MSTRMALCWFLEAHLILRYFGVKIPLLPKIKFNSDSAIWETRTMRNQRPLIYRRPLGDFRNTSLHGVRRVIPEYRMAGSLHIPRISSRYCSTLSGAGFIKVLFWIFTYCKPNTLVPQDWGAEFWESITGRALPWYIAMASGVLLR